MLVSMLMRIRFVQTEQGMQEQQYAITESHNLYLHKLVDNQQTKSVMLMKLDSHRTLFRDGVESRYLTNLVIAGRNFVEIFAVFQGHITLSMGNWPIYEDITQVEQWDRNIVITAGNKVIGLIYEDCIIKNSFMLSLQFLELGPLEKPYTVCDQAGHYMVVCSNRQILLCVSQKAIEKHKAKPFYHRNTRILEEDVKWNRPEFQYISDVIMLELEDFALSKVSSFSFSDDKVYFLGHSCPKSSEKKLHYIPLLTIFNEDQNSAMMLDSSPQQPSVQRIYPIHRGIENQYLVIRDNHSIELHTQKGTIMLQSHRFSQTNSAPILIIRNSGIFPFYVYHKNSIFIYRRESASKKSLCSTTASQIYRSEITLSSKIHIKSLDIKDKLLVYCNDYEVALLDLHESEHEVSKSSAQEEQNAANAVTDKLVLKQSLGRIIDFTLVSGRNILAVENYHDDLCRMILLLPEIKEDNRPFYTHPKKNAMQAIGGLRAIRTLNSDIQPLIAAESAEQRQAFLSLISNMVIVQSKNQSYQIYEMNSSLNVYSPILQLSFNYYVVIKDTFGIVKKDAIVLVLWSRNMLKLLFCKFSIPGGLQVISQVADVQLTKQIKNWEVSNIDEYLVTVTGQSLIVSFYNMKNGRSFQIDLMREEGEKLKKGCKVQVIKKNITFRKKDKDFFFLEILAVMENNALQIWEISVDTQESKISHRTEEVGEGLAILFNDLLNVQKQQINPSGSKYRSITCPEYSLFEKINSDFPSPGVLKMHTCEFEGQKYLFLVNHNEKLFVYRKQYCDLSSMGYLYHRIPLQLSFIKNFRYSEKNTFVAMGCGVLRISNYAFYKGELLLLPDGVLSCFEMDAQIWSLQRDGKIRMLLAKGKMISHFLVQEIPTSINKQIVGIKSTNKIIVIYSHSCFEVFDKEMNPEWKPTEKQFDSSKQRIIAICAFNHHVAVSYCNYWLSDSSNQEYQSMKFKLRVYSQITKSKILQREGALEEPALFIEHYPPDKLIIVTHSNIFVYNVKNQKSLEIFRIRNYSRRTMLSCFSYSPEKIGGAPGFMVFGGIYGGLSFMVGNWIEKEKLQEKWYEGLRCGIRETEIFHYGKQTQFLKCLIADDCGNLMVMNLQPAKAEKLADIHLGSQVNSMFKVNGNPYMCCDDGCIYILSPIQLKNVEISFEVLQGQFCEEIPVLGGLNNRDSRCLRQKYRSYKIPSCGDIVDSDVIKHLFSLTECLKDYVFEKADNTSDNIQQSLFANI